MSNTNGDYISRADAKAVIQQALYDGTGYGEALNAVPPADVRPVVRGEWKKAYADHEAFGVRPFYRYCSECLESTVFPYSFCPHCGADMRPEKEDSDV